MDWSGIAAVVVAILGGGGLIGLGRVWAAYQIKQQDRKMLRDDQTDKRIFEFTDDLRDQLKRSTATLERQSVRIDRITADLSAANQQIAALQAQIAAERLEKATHAREAGKWREQLEARESEHRHEMERLQLQHRLEREQDAFRIAKLEAEVERQGRLLAQHNIVDGGAHGPSSAATAADASP